MRVFNVIRNNIIYAVQNLFKLIGLFLQLLLSKKSSMAGLIRSQLLPHWARAPRTGDPVLRSPRPASRGFSISFKTSFPRWIFIPKYDNLQTFVIKMSSNPPECQSNCSSRLPCLTFLHCALSYQLCSTFLHCVLSNQIKGPRRAGRLVQADSHIWLFSTVQYQKIKPRDREEQEGWSKRTFLHFLLSNQKTKSRDRDEQEGWSNCSSRLPSHLTLGSSMALPSPQVSINLLAERCISVFKSVDLLRSQ